MERRYTRIVKILDEEWNFGINNIFGSLIGQQDIEFKNMGKGSGVNQEL